MFAVHAAYRDLRLRGEPTGNEPNWEWTSPRAVQECLSTCWHMTGRWKARRQVTMKRSNFDQRVLSIVPRLARDLNRGGIQALGDLARLNDKEYRRVVRAIHLAVADISSLRHTQSLQPVLGSKVLHHFFPSVVPVFDTALIRKGVMRTTAFAGAMQADEDGWVFLDTAKEAGGPALLEYHRYFAFVAREIGNTEAQTLRRVREVFGRSFAPGAPNSCVRDRTSTLWQMDAKLGEYCLLGEAVREGLVDGS